MIETQYFEPEGRAVPFYDEGEGPVSLVLIPGTRADGATLGVVAHYLVEEAGFHVLRVGTPDTDAPERDDVDVRVDEVLGVLDHLGVERAWLGGHGFGGTVARTIADRFPERADGLLLLGVQDVPIPLAPVIPVLIVQGSEDDVNPSANGDALQATAPERTSIKTVDGGDHHFPSTQPVETAVIIEEYLDWD